MTFSDAKKNLLRTYSKYGVTEDMIVSCLRSGIEEYGFSVDGAYNGLRMELAKLSGEEHEYFSVEDMMSITGLTRDECVQAIEDMRKEVSERGENPDDYARKIEPQEMSVMYFPNGIK